MAETTKAGTAARTESSVERASRKTRTGLVVSDKMDKT